MPANWTKPERRTNFDGLRRRMIGTRHARAVKILLMTNGAQGGAKAASRKALLVLGMHRSGTSATAGLLIRLGAQGPASLMRPKADNPRGFWESDALYGFHERLLHAAGSRWDSWARFSPIWCDSHIPAELTNELRALLLQEFGNAPLFVVKDPRICRLVPFWLRSLEGERISVAAVIQLRSPLEVSQSLESRNGLGQQHALLMWLRHMLDAEFETRKVPRTFVRYSDVLENWTRAADKMARDLRLEWPQRSSATELEIAQFIDRDLRHHAMPIETLNVASPLADWVRQTCAALDLLVEEGARHAGDAMDSLDQVREAFDRTTSLFEPAFDAQRRRAATVEAELEAHQRHAAGIEAAYHALQQQTADMEASNNRLERHTKELDSEKQVLGQQLAKLEQRRQELERELTRTQQHVEALLGSMSWRMTAPLRSAGRLWSRRQQRDGASPSKG